MRCWIYPKQKPLTSRGDAVRVGSAPYRVDVYVGVRVPVAIGV